MVMIYHFSIVERISTLGLDSAYYKLSLMGWSGVDLFFVLSGFLITGILIESKQSSATYFKSFYLRRVLRIFPLYYAFLFGLFFVLPLIAGRVLPVEQFDQLRSLEQIQLWFWLYATNIWTFLTGEHTGFATSHFWSLAIEEQFYLIWPLVVFAVSRVRLQQTCIALIGIALLLRIAMAVGGVSFLSIYTFTPARMDALLTGALVAILVRAPIPSQRLRRAAGAVLAAAGPTVFTILWLSGQDTNAHALIYTVGFSLLAVCFASLILLAVTAPEGSLLSRALRNRTLRFLGKYSYCLYVVHVMIRAVMVRAVGDPIVIAGTQLIWQLGFIVLCSAISIAVAMLSWHLMEKRFLELKERFPY